MRPTCSLLLPSIKKYQYKYVKQNLYGTVPAPTRHSGAVHANSLEEKMTFKERFGVGTGTDGNWAFVPQGWRVVPEVPTQDMLDSGAEAGGFDVKAEKDNTAAIYLAMLQSAPIAAVTNAPKRPTE